MKDILYIGYPSYMKDILYIGYPSYMKDILYILEGLLLTFSFVELLLLPDPRSGATGRAVRPEASLGLSEFSSKLLLSIGVDRASE